MNFTFETSVPALTVFFQGLLSFFSPCVLPIVPLYISYFSGGAKTVDADGTIHYPRGRVLLNTLFFVLGISAAFFLLGFASPLWGSFFPITGPGSPDQRHHHDFIRPVSAGVLVAPESWSRSIAFLSGWIVWPWAPCPPFFWASPSASPGRPAWGRFLEASF